MPRALFELVITSVASPAVLLHGAMDGLVDVLMSFYELNSKNLGAPMYPMTDMTAITLRVPSSLL